MPDPHGQIMKLEVQKFHSIFDKPVLDESGIFPFKI